MKRHDAQADAFHAVRNQERYDGTEGLQYAPPLDVEQAARLLNIGLYNGDLEWMASECQPDLEFPSIMHRIWDTLIDDGEYIGPSTESEAIKAVSNWAGDCGTVYVDEDGCIVDNYEDFCYCSTDGEHEDGEELEGTCSYCDGLHTVTSVNVAEAFLPKEVYSHYV